MVTGRRLIGWANLLLTVALGAAAWVLVTVLATRPAFKSLWDVSPQARFTVDPATAELLGEIRDRDQVLEVHTLFAPLGGIRPADAEQRQAIAIRVRLHELTRDLLRQYEYLGGDAVVVTHHDLNRAPGDVREVVREIQARRYDSVILKIGERSKVLTIDEDLAEFDLPHATNPVTGQRPLPTLKDYKGEEAISTAIKRLMVEGTPRVYFLASSDLGPSGMGAGSYSEMVGALEDDGFDVASLDLRKTRRVPDDADVIALIDPTYEMHPDVGELLYQFVRRGGRLFVNLHYYGQPPDYNISLRALGERFGFELSEELLCHVRQDPEDPRRTLGFGPECQNLIAWNMNPAHPVTRPLLRRGRYPRFKVGRAIRAAEGSMREGVRVDTSFLQTGPGGWLEARDPRTGMVDYVGPQQQAAYGAVPFGAVIDVDPRDGERAGHVVVIAAEGFDNLSFEFNGDLALNLFNWLTERKALISVRGKKYVSRKLELAPEQIDRVGLLLVAIVPGLMFALGLLVFWRRSRS